LGEVPLDGSFRTLATHARGRVLWRSETYEGDEVNVQLIYPDERIVFKRVHTGVIVEVDP
jgi:hypothetical protein